MAKIRSLRVTVTSAGTPVVLSATPQLVQSIWFFVPTNDAIELGDLTVSFSTTRALPVNAWTGPWNSTDPTNPINLNEIFADAANDGDVIQLIFVEM